MSQIIAFCPAAPIFLESRILNKNFAKKYPGALWVAELQSLTKETQFEVVTGDIAIAKIEAGTWNPLDILVIQEESSSIGLELTHLGAKLFLQVCFESPLYASAFYANLGSKSAFYKNRILFRGAFPSTSKTGINHTLYFPSYSLDEFSEGLEWGSRHFVVMVAGNKYWNHNRSFLRYFVAKLRNIIMRRKSYITNEIKQWQLHDKRLELIEYFGKKQGFNLFGGNWNDISNLPKVWRRRLGKIIDDLNPTTCDDKHEILLNYKFAICLENIAYPGYVTEKIIDCFKAGVIPIYLGAPDIYDFVPSDAFIDLREYENCDGLYEYLSEISEDKAMEIIQKGRSFLSSSAGHEFSYEVFAKHVIDMANQHG